MTEIEWQELSDFLAREVMGFEKVRATTEFDKPLPAVFWTRDEGEGPRCKYLVARPLSHAWMDWDVWKPYENIAQAMLVLKTLLKNIGRYATAELNIHISPNRCRVMIQNWVATDGTPARWVRSPYADNEMQAICLAAKEWSKAQREGNR